MGHNPRITSIGKPLQAAVWLDRTRSWRPHNAMGEILTLGHDFGVIPCRRRVNGGLTQIARPEILTAGQALEFVGKSLAFADRRRRKKIGNFSESHPAGEDSWER